jgi:hypothetical protein
MSTGGVLELLLAHHLLGIEISIYFIELAALLFFFRSFHFVTCLVIYCFGRCSRGDGLDIDIIDQKLRSKVSKTRFYLTDMLCFKK